MKNTYVLIVFIFACALSVQAQDYTPMYVTTGSPQANLINPGYMPESSYLTMPVLGGVSFRVTNSFFVDDIIDNRTLRLSKIPGGSELNSGFNLNIINFGVLISDKSMITFSSGVKTNIDFMYPADAFDLIVDNPNGSVDSFDIDFKSSSTVWGEVAVGYTRAINENWSVGAKLKYLVGAIGGTSNNSKFEINQTPSTYTIQGDVDIRIGGHDTSRDDFDPENIIRNVGWATDLGIYYKSDNNRYTIGFSVLDLGYINWNDGCHVVSKDPSKIYRFNGFGNIEDVVNSGELSSLTDQIYDNMLDAIEIDTIKMSFRRMLPTTIYLGGGYSIDQVGRHTLTANCLNRINGASIYDYSVSAGYVYSSKSKRFKLITSLTNRRYDPLSIGFGMTSTTTGFKFYMMGDVSISSLARATNQRDPCLSVGMDVLLGKRRHLK